VELESHFIDIAITVVSSAVFGLIGFVWKVSHKVSSLEREVQNLDSKLKGAETQTKHDISYLMNKVDAHNDKMYSIVRNQTKG